MPRQLHELIDWIGLAYIAGGGRECTALRSGGCTVKGKHFECEKDVRGVCGLGIKWYGGRREVGVGKLRCSIHNNSAGVRADIGGFAALNIGRKRR